MKAGKKTPTVETKDIPLTAKQFIEALSAMQSEMELKNVQRFFREINNVENKFLGVRMGDIFKLAGEFKDMSLAEIEKLLESKYYEARMGAVSIMDFQARNKKTTEERKKQLFELYINNHDRINNWDLVDRSAPYVVGGYLWDKPRKILYKLARSKNVWERRTAIVSTYFFIKKGDIKDTFQIAELLLNDKHDLIHKAVGSWIREAGKKDSKMLLSFLDSHAGKMPRAMIRYAVEKLEPKKRAFYLSK
ncbi:MAG: DNA alkylation repair protein [Marivirga sp.]|nr:DNA alkylation repair protein [Marivirga sp.]